MGEIEWGPVGWRYKGWVMCFLLLFFQAAVSGVWHILCCHIMPIELKLCHASIIQGFRFFISYSKLYF